MDWVVPFDECLCEGEGDVRVCLLVGAAKAAAFVVGSVRLKTSIAEGVAAGHHDR